MACGRGLRLAREKAELTLSGVTISLPAGQLGKPDEVIRHDAVAARQRAVIGLLGTNDERRVRFAVQKIAAAALVEKFRVRAGGKADGPVEVTAFKRRLIQV